jgi:hypothetical protein
VPDHEELVGRQRISQYEQVVHGQRLGRRQVMVGGKLLRMGRRVVRVPLDSDNVVRKISAQIVADGEQQLLGAILQVVAARHEHAVGGRLNAHDVAVLPHLKTGNLLDRQVF